jgi:hypothetical protein
VPLHLRALTLGVAIRSSIEEAFGIGANRRSAGARLGRNVLPVGDLALATRIEPISFATIATAGFPVLLALE